MTAGVKKPLRDGIDQPRIKRCPERCKSCAVSCLHALGDQRARREGWEPIETAPIAKLGVVIPSRGLCTFTSAPAYIEGLTTHGAVVLARYNASAKDYKDTWSSADGRVIYSLTHWRKPLESER